MKKTAASHDAVADLVIALARLEPQVEAQRLGWLRSSVKAANTKQQRPMPDRSAFAALAARGMMLPYPTWCKLSGLAVDGDARASYSRMWVQKKFPKVATITPAITAEARAWAQSCDAGIELSQRGIFKMAAYGLEMQSGLEIPVDMHKPVTESELRYAGYQLQLLETLSEPAACRLMLATNFLN